MSNLFMSACVYTFAHIHTQAYTDYTHVLHILYSMHAHTQRDVHTYHIYCIAACMRWYKLADNSHSQTMLRRSMVSQVFPQKNMLLLSKFSKQKNLSPPTFSNQWFQLHTEPIIKMKTSLTLVSNSCENTKSVLIKITVVKG